MAIGRIGRIPGGPLYPLINWAGRSPAFSLFFHTPMFKFVKLDYCVTDKLIGYTRF